MAARLRAALRVRGVAWADCDDVVQEVAARVLSARPAFGSADELYGWARTVGIRLTIAEYRRLQRIEFAEVPELADPMDVDAHVEGRLRLERVARELESLSEQDRDAIAYGLVERPPEWDRRTTMRWDVRRHRARERLRERLEGGRLAGGGLVAWLRERLRGLVRIAEPASTSLVAVAGWLLPVVGSALAPLSAPSEASTLVHHSSPPAVGSPAAPTPRPSATEASRPAVRRGAARPGPTPTASTTTTTTSTPPRTPPTTILWVDGRGGATRDDGDALEVCVEGPVTRPVVPDGCPVSVTPWTVVPPS